MASFEDRGSGITHFRPPHFEQFAGYLNIVWLNAVLSTAVLLCAKVIPSDHGGQMCHYREAKDKKVIQTKHVAISCVLPQLCVLIL